MRNLEFKAAALDLNAVQARAVAMGADLWGDLRQTDTYFSVAKGRLKLRETSGRQAELVFYQRDESAPHRPSDYEIAQSAQPDAMRLLLTQALGVLAVVRKRRTLLILDSARVHLDNVDSLGTFVELEVPVSAGETAAQTKIDELITGLGLSWQDCIRSSYLEMTLDKDRRGS